MMTLARTVLAHPSRWANWATLLCLLWSLLFWYLFLVLFSVDYLGMGLGLGGVVYPLFFSVPVLLGSLIYERLVRNSFIRPNWGLQKRLFWTLWVPFLIIAIALCLFCPTDSQLSYPAYLWTKLQIVV